jgi:hypothetical protein
MVIIVLVMAVVPPVPDRVKAKVPALNPDTGAVAFTELSAQEDMVIVLTA